MSYEISQIAHITFAAGDRKIATIKAIRDAFGIGLLEAKISVERGMLVSIDSLGTVVNTMIREFRKASIDTKISATIVDDMPLPFRLPFSALNNVASSWDWPQS